jgi:hypothetical protein
LKSVQASSPADFILWSNSRDLFRHVWLVVSYKPLKHIRKGQHEALIHALISSGFCRGMRLFLPPAVTTFIVAIAVYMQLYNAPYDLMPGIIPRHPENYRSLFLQLRDWARFLIVDMTHPWRWKSPKSECDSHLWTIPIQFRSSMILFLAITGLAKTHTRVRAAPLFLLHVYCIMQKRWEVTLFLAGMFLAERNLIQIELETQDISRWADTRFFQGS